MDHDDRPDAFVGQLLDGRYRIGEPLGSGGMGTVYRATHELIGKQVAVKVLKQRLANHSDLVARFTREARAAAQIEHPNICATHDMGTTEEGAPYLVMELLAGETLQERLRREPQMEPRLVAELGAQLCDGLERAHALGIVHRDLKPGNIILTKPHGTLQAKILDFGVAHLLDGDDDDVEQTNPGALFGTPPYVSPEQAIGDPVDRRSDLYAVGVILFEMLCGQRPFTSRHPAALLKQHQVRPPPSVRQLRTSVPAALDALVMRLLAKAPDHRFATAADVAVALRGLGLDAPMPSAPPEAQVVPAAPDPQPSRVPPEPTQRASPRFARLIPRDIAERMCVVAMGREGRSLLVAMADPSDRTAVDELAFLTGHEIKTIGLAEAAVRELLSKAYDT